MEKEKEALRMLEKYGDLLEGEEMGGMGLNREEKGTQELQTAPDRKRIAARVIDIVIVLIILVCLCRNETIMLALTQIGFSQKFFAAYVLSLIAFFMLNIVFIFSNGRTIGKKLLKIKVVTCENKVPPVWLIFIREMFFYTIVIAMFLLYFVPEFSDILDKMTNTRVVPAEK